MMNIQMIDWNAAWKEARAKCNFQIRDSAFWDERAPNFAEISMKTGYAESFLEIMKPEKNWSIFDMACGAGTLAIPFARYVKSVTAVDFSEKMLEILRERCSQAGISNVRTLKASWEDDWSEAGIGLHDVALASRSLVVDDLRHGIEKLNNIARKRVYISTIVDDGPHDRRIFEAVGRELHAGPDYIYNYNLLYRMGIFANVNFIIEDNQKTYGSHAEALDSVRWMLDDITSDEEKKLEDYFGRHLIFNEGRWVMDCHRIVRWAVIWWDKAANIK